MKDRKKVSIFYYLVSVIPFSFLNRKNFYRLLLCSALPLLFGTSVAAYTDSPQIAQVNTAGSINRPSLKVGSQGDAVSELQAALKLMGYYNGAVDGKFGETTATAVSQFKQSAGLAPDGVVDSNTWQTLFPGQTTIGNNSTEQTTITTTTTNNFPVPNQTAANLPRPVVVSNQQSTTSTARRNTGNAQQLETVRVATTRTTTNNSSNNNPRNNNSRQTARVQQSTTTTSTNNRGRSGNTTASTRSNTTTRGRSGNTVASTRSSTTTRGSAARETLTTSTYRTRQTDPNLQKPGIQYTAVGFPILRLGMRGEEVYDLQTRLQRLGYLKKGPDGDFGADTEAAVKELQQRFGLQPDGVAGGETWEILTRRRTNRSQS
jgi:peptidoglycan hydrolase-like protein with peptidoglycan-binding domain